MITSSDGKRVEPGTVYLVGSGPGAADLITLRGLRLIRSADVIVYDALASRELLDEAKSECEHIYVGKRGYCVGSTRQETINDIMLDRARKGLRVVRLKGGDPCVFGRGGEEAEFLVERGIRVEIVPGITTAIGGCATASIPLTHRDAGQSVALVTGHYDPDSEECRLDWAGLSGMSNLVVYMGLRHIEKIARRLMESGMPANTPAAVIENATLPHQRVVDGTLETIASLTRDAEVAAPAIIVIGECVRMRERLLNQVCREGVLV